MKPKKEEKKEEKVNKVNKVKLNPDDFPEVSDYVKAKKALAETFRE